MKYTRDQKAKAFDNLPPKIREAIMSEDMDKTLGDLTRKYKLRIDQGSAFSELVTITMLGLEKSGSFKTNLMEKANISEIVAGGLTKDAEEMIFRKIKNSLMKMTDKSEEEEASDHPINEAGEKMTHAELLAEIEDPRESSSIASLDEITEEEPKRANDSWDDSSDTEINNSNPSNLPTGNIKDVPKHGHGGHPELQNDSVSTEEDIVVENKFNQATTSSHQEINLEAKDSKESTESTKSKPAFVDPYREPIE